MGRILLSLAALTTLAAVPSIANAHPYLGGGVRFAAPGISVAIAPPAPRIEYRPATPYDGAVWAPGHWQWNGYRYVWIGGFHHPSRIGWVWAPAHWQPEFAGGFIYVPGHWVRSGYAWR